MLPTFMIFGMWPRQSQSKSLKQVKKKGCEILKDWTKSIKNHLYWCVTSTKYGFVELIKAKWLSLIQHVSDRHCDHPIELFPVCNHGELEPRDWILPGKKTHILFVINIQQEDIVITWHLSRLVISLQ